jgi:branched-chain amino acid transport system substrate-binding protein
MPAKNRRRGGMMKNTLTICAVAAALVALTTMSAGAQTAPIKIGVLGDQSSAYSDLGGKGSVVAAEMAVEDFGGKLFGQPIEIVSADHQNKPEIAANIARRWYDRDGVTMITDLTNSAVALAVQNVSKEKKRIDLVTSTATTALTNEECSPYGVHWTFDSYALSVGTAKTLVEQGGKSWYFVTADYTFGYNLEDNARRIITAGGGKILGSAKAPLNTTDFSSQLLEAQSSGAQVIGLANSGADTANSVKQAAEFGITKKQKLAAFLPFITDIKAMGLDNAQGLVLTTAFYWDMDDAKRAWGERFFKRQGIMPTQVHAGTYSAVLHYLKAAKAANSSDAGAVMQKMREMPVDDPLFKGSIRADGQMMHDMYLVQVKTPAESKRDWDFYKIVKTIPAEQAFTPAAESKCSLMKKG